MGNSQTNFSLVRPEIQDIIESYYGLVDRRNQCIRIYQAMSKPEEKFVYKEDTIELTSGIIEETTLTLQNLKSKLFLLQTAQNINATESIQIDSILQSIEEQLGMTGID